MDAPILSVNHRYSAIGEVMYESVKDQVYLGIESCIARKKVRILYSHPSDYGNCLLWCTVTMQVLDGGNIGKITKLAENADDLCTEQPVKINIFYKLSKPFGALLCQAL